MCLVSGNGWVTDVKHSPELAKAVDSALKANVPKETLETFFKKLKVYSLIVETNFF